jgi:ferrous iron transport protein B
MSATKAWSLSYDDPIESALHAIGALLRGDYRLSRRAIGLLLLQGDHDVETDVREKEGPGYHDIGDIILRARADYGQPLRQVIALRRQQEARRILGTASSSATVIRPRFADRLSRAMMSPWTGIPILLVVLYVGLYQFVGVFGAGIAVDFIEGTLFGRWVNPWITDLVNAVVPYQPVRDLFVGDYGIITLGLTYGIAIVLPIVGTFFIMFAIIEDSGYLPRLAMLTDRLFKVIGLSGRAVIPMTLGFGCDTMATIVTRTQETKRERVITTLLLALAIPCSAQLGVILAILSGNGLALLIWGTVMVLVMLLVGYLASKVIRGDSPSFYAEIPPLRLPKVSNVLTKTYARMQWYFMEVIPIFILASVLLWLGDLTGLFDIVVRGLEPLVESIGLPSETAMVFLFGFFRRDFGAAGLYDLHASGVLLGVPLVVAAVTLTLFVPCVAQFGVMLKERGVKTAFAIALFIFPFAFFVGFVLNEVLVLLGVSL